MYSSAMRSARFYRAVSIRLVLAAAAALLASSAGCSKSAKHSSSSADARLSVPTVKPERRSLSRRIEQPGRIEAYEQTPIFAKISGYVAKVKVERGDVVHKGDVLAELWVPEMEEELKAKEQVVAQARIGIKQAENNLEVAKANQKTAVSLVAEAKANLKRAEANQERWKSQYARFENLLRDKVLNEQDRDEARDQFKAAQADRELAAAKIQSAEAAREESDAKTAKAESDVEAARRHLAVSEADRRRTAVLLDYATLRAPFDGIVSQRQVDTGHFLQPGLSGTGSKTEPLFVVVRTDRVRIFVDVPETDAVLVQKNTPARIRIQALNDQEFEGKVAGSSWALEPAQRTLRAEIDFTNSGGKLRPGMYAYASIDVEQPEAFTIPASAVLTRDGETFCYCVADGKAVRTPIRIGARADSVLEVLKKLRPPVKRGEKGKWENLTGAEEVVEANPAELTDGQAVVVTAGTR